VRGAQGCLPLLVRSQGPSPHLAPVVAGRPVARELLHGRKNYEAPRSWAERAYPKLIDYNRVADGGHYAAWEQPTLFTKGSPRSLQATLQIDLSIGDARVARAASTRQFARQLPVRLRFRFAQATPDTTLPGGPAWLRHA